MDKKEFEKLGLKNIDELDKHFEITSIKEEAFLLRAVRRKIADKIDHVIQMLSHYMEPDGIIQFNDAHALDDHDRDEVMRLLKEFSIIYKHYIELEIESNENEEKEFCMKSLETYKANITALKMLVSKVKKAYNSEQDIKVNTDYLG